MGTGEDIDSDRGEEAHPDFVAALVKIWISNAADVYWENKVNQIYSELFCFHWDR